MSDILHDWQKTGRLFPGYKKGEVKFIMLKSRGAGKSMYNTMRMQFGSQWKEWKNSFTFWPRRSYTGKWIWGKIMVRRNIFVINDDGSRVLEYASRKEAFKDNLKNG